MIIKYPIKSTKSELVISPSTVINQFLVGIPLSGLSEDKIGKFILAATKQLEGYLNLKLKKQVFKETLDYTWQDFQKFGYMQTTYPVLSIHSLHGKIGNLDQLSFPLEWLVKKEVNDDEGYQRTINLIPTSLGSPVSLAAINSISAYPYWLASQVLPHYWDIVYCTSFNKVPQDIIEAIGKLTAINALQVIGDLIGGVGIGGNSIGLDGLNQSLTLTKTAGNSAFSGRQKTYTEELVNDMKMLKQKYDGMILTVL